MEVSTEQSPARLVGDFAADRLYLEIGDARSQARLRVVLGALPLLQLRPHPGGRKVGSRQREDVDALRAQIREARSGLEADGDRVSWAAVARIMGWESSALRKKAQRLGIEHPLDIRP